MIIALVLLSLVLAAVVRYGADTRSGDAADHRDPALPRGPQYAHTPAADLRILAALACRAGGHRQLWSAYDHSLRPWETNVRPDRAV